MHILCHLFRLLLFKIQWLKKRRIHNMSHKERLYANYWQTIVNIQEKFSCLILKLEFLKPSKAKHKNKCFVETCFIIPVHDVHFSPATRIYFIKHIVATYLPRYLHLDWFTIVKFCELVLKFQIYHSRLITKHFYHLLP